MINSFAMNLKLNLLSFFLSFIKPETFSFLRSDKQVLFAAISGLGTSLVFPYVLFHLILATTI